MIIVVKPTQLLNVYVDVVQQTTISQQTQLYAKDGKAFKLQSEGDGDPSVTVTVTIGNASYQFTGDQVVLDTQESGTLTITASGSGKTPTIRILRFA